MLTLKELEERTLRWGKAKGILDNGNKFTQSLKLVSEAGELKEAYMASDEAEVIDAIGDILIVLTSLAYHAKSSPLSSYQYNIKASNILVHLGDLCDNVIKDKDISNEVYLIMSTLEEAATRLNIQLEECWESALEVIEKRVGTMNANGDFIKDTIYAGRIGSTGDFEQEGTDV